MSYQQCPQKELSAKVLCCNNRVSQSLSDWNEGSEFKDQQDQKFTYKDQRRSMIKDQLVSRIKRSKFIRDQSSSEIKVQQDQRSRKSTGDQLLSDHGSKVQSSTLHRSDH